MIKTAKNVLEITRTKANFRAFAGLEVCKLRGRDVYHPECALWLGLLLVITESLRTSQLSGCIDDC